jgi:NAD(P)-dependent dehydrogenase (short-subunit alcohol dehydrogenase family)
MSDPKYRTILITGAAGGIGRATVQLFAESGWQVIGVDRAPFEGSFPAGGLSILRSVFMGVKLAHPLLKASGQGAVVNVSSVHAVATSANIAAYAASKGGLLALTRAMAIEFAPDDIRVNAILPGAVDTQMLRAGLVRDHAGAGTMEERLENLARNTVNGRVGRPEEIAHAIYFLADHVQSSFMTGQALIVDGGATARLSTE